jgi:hypothetical protein
MKTTNKSTGRIKPMVKWSPDPTFGEYLNVALPRDCDMIIVCVDTLQHQPRLMLLPHQCYRKEMKKLIAKDGAESITIIPYRNKDKIMVSKLDI